LRERYPLAILMAYLIFDDEIRKELPLILSKAEKKIIIVNFLIASNLEHRTWLASLLRSQKVDGVEVVVILNGAFRDRKAYITAVNFQSVVNKDIGKAFITTDKKVEHRKIIIIDERYLLIGSHNLTQKSFEQNKEISVFIDDDVLSKRAYDEILKN
jgi:phosphatidylserine/phosphatidylglycerophosphate/cardiolipin synthase-like enzyme